MWNQRRLLQQRPHGGRFGSIGSFEQVGEPNWSITIARRNSTRSLLVGDWRASLLSLLSGTCGIKNLHLGAWLCSMKNLRGTRCSTSFKLLRGLSSSSSIVTLAQIGNYTACFISTAPNIWVIDLGASDHMTENKNILFHFEFSIFTASYNTSKWFYILHLRCGRC